MPAIAHENKILGNINTLDDLTDVDLTSPQNGQVPIYNSTTQKWENGNQSGGATELNELDDVSITSPANGQVLTIRNGEWVNEAPQAGDSIIYLTKSQYDALTPAQDQMYGITDWTPEALAVIDDSVTVENKAWSSNKTNTELSAKANASEVIKWSEATTSVKKNLLPNNATSQTISGVTFTVNSDGTVTANGTNTSTYAGLNLLAGTDSLKLFSELPLGDYIISGSNGGAENTYRIMGTYRYNGTWYTFATNYDGDTRFTLTQEIKNATIITINIRVYGAVNNVTFKPMLRLASIADATYEPYIPDNTELMRYTDNAVLGAKNLLPNNATSQTINGVTLTKNADGTVTANGTATSEGLEYVVQNYQLKAGTYKISKGEPTDITIQLVLDDMSNNRIATVVQDREVTFTLSVDTYVKCYIWFSESAVFNNYVYKPMLRLATDTDDTYVPYAMTNRELSQVSTTSISQNGLTVDFVKKGFVVQMTISGGSLTSAISANATMVTIPSGYEPLSMYGFNSLNSLTSINRQGRFYAKSEGVIQPSDNLAVGDAVRASAIYIAKN